MKFLGSPLDRGFDSGKLLGSPPTNAKQLVNVKQRAKQVRAIDRLLPPLTVGL